MVLSDKTHDVWVFGLFLLSNNSRCFVKVDYFCFEFKNGTCICKCSCCLRSDGLRLIVRIEYEINKELWQR